MTFFYTDIARFNTKIWKVRKEVTCRTNQKWAMGRVVLLIDIPFMIILSDTLERDVSTE